MKKLLTLLMLLCMVCTGAWAFEVGTYTIKPYSDQTKYLVPSATWATRGGNKTAYAAEATNENGGEWAIAATGSKFYFSPANTSFARGYLNPWSSSSNASGAIGCWDTNGNGSEDLWTITAVEGLDNVYTISGVNSTYMYYNSSASELYYNKPGTPAETNYFVIEKVVPVLNVPFELSSSKDAPDAKWYSIQFRNTNGNTYAYVANNSSTQLGQSTDGSTLTDNQKAFCFVQNGEGFYIYNKGTGLGVAVDAVTDHAPVKVSETPTLIKYRLNGSDHFLYDGVTNNQNNTLASWSSSDAFIAISAATSRSNYNGARAVFTLLSEEIEVTYNITATDSEGNYPISIVRTKTQEIGSQPSIAVDYFDNIQIENAVAIDADHTSFNATAVYNYPMMPGKEYLIKYGSTYVNYVSETEVNIKASTALADNRYVWYVVSKGDGTFWLCSKQNEKAVIGKNNSAAAVEFGDPSGSTKTYEFVKSGDKFKLFETGANASYNLGSHGTSGSTANAALGRWQTQRTGGTEFTAEESNFVFYHINYVGLTAPAEGGVCYNRVNYTGETLGLTNAINESALIAMHVSGYNGTVSVDEANKIITVTYSTEAETTSTLWHGNVATNSNQIMPASRIPAIITANNGDILAFSDWRYNFNDIGRGDMGGHIDIEMRRSTDGGQTWKPAVIAARGTGSGTTAGYGDAAVVADRTTSESQQLLLLAAAGSVSYTANNRSNSIRMAKFTSSNNGATWSEATDITSEIFAILPDNVKGFFATSGKITQASFKAAGASHNRIYSVLCTTTDGGSTNTNYVIYSDDFGTTWAVLGGTETPAMAGGNEAHVTELPNGDLLLDSRASGRLVNLFTYSDKDAATGTWGESGQKSITVGTACNGDIDVIDGYRAGTADAVKVLIQSAPRANSRSNIRYYYKELPAQTDGHYTLSDFVGGWTEGYQVCAGSSAYSSITSAGTGVEYMLYEKNTTNDTFNYDIEFAKHNISDITNGAYLDHATEALTINYTLTDVNGATYQGSCTGVEGTAPTFTGAYGYSLSEEAWGEVVDNTVTYTARINFGFPVSSNNVNKWVNLIYLPNYDRYVSYDGTNAKMRQAYKEAAQNDPGTSKDQTNFIWSVIPVLEAGTNNFGFKIYSKGANKYVSATDMAHQAQVALAAEGDVFQLVTPTSNPNASHKNDNKGVFVKQSGGNTFSICTESATGRDFLTFWNVATSSHAGQNVAIVEAWDMQEYDELLNMLKNNVGTKLGQYSSSTKTADEMAEVISSCELMRDVHGVYYTSIANMTEVVSTLTLNMPQPGMFLRIKASYNNKKAWSGVADEQELYLTSEISTQNTGRAAFALTEGCSNATNTIFYYDGSKNLIAYDKGVRAVNNSNFLQIGAVGAEGTIVTFEEIGRSTEAGAYRIEFNNGGRSLYCQRASGNYYTDAAGGNMSDAHYRYFLEEVEALPVSIGATKFATFYTPVELQVPAEVTAYVCNLSGKNLAMYTCKQTDGEHILIPAGTAVMLNAPEQTEATAYNFTIPATTQAEVYDNNSFFGDVVTKAFESMGSDTYYSLQRDNANVGQVGFFVKPSGNFKGFQAFLSTPASQAPVQRFNVTFDEDAIVTDITNVLGTENITIPAFDLSGRKVDANSHRGLYIMNGKKVIR